MCVTVAGMLMKMSVNSCQFAVCLRDFAGSVRKLQVIRGMDMAARSFCARKEGFRPAAKETFCGVGSMYANPAPLSLLTLDGKYARWRVGVGASTGQ
jgi:hypothetical protein